MRDFEKIHAAAVEKQNIIANEMHELNYDALINLLANTSALIFKIDKILAEEESNCHKIVTHTMSLDTRATFSKAEAMMKSSPQYIEYKKIMGLKQLTTRGFNILKAHFANEERPKELEIESE